MRLQIPNLSQLDVQDFFVIIFLLFLITAFVLRIPLLPFKFSSLVVFWMFLATCRSLVKEGKFFPFLIIGLLGLIFSTFLSPYGLLVYFLLTVTVYSKTNLL